MNGTALITKPGAPSREKEVHYFVYTKLLTTVIKSDTKLTIFGVSFTVCYYESYHSERTWHSNSGDQWPDCNHWWWWCSLYRYNEYLKVNLKKRRLLIFLIWQEGNSLLVLAHERTSQAPEDLPLHSPNIHALLSRYLLIFCVDRRFLYLLLPFHV